MRKKETAKWPTHLASVLALITAEIATEITAKIATEIVTGKITTNTIISHTIDISGSILSAQFTLINI
jgi:ribosomal protein S25